MTCRTGIVVLASATVLTVSSPVAAQKLSVGIAPFDVVSVEGASDEASMSMAKLVRVEMIKAGRLQPQLLTPPPDSPTPLPRDEAVKLGRAAKVDIVLVGTVLEAGTSSSSRGANTGGLLGGIGVGARHERVTAKVMLNIELVDPKSGDVADTFDVESSNSESGMGADLSTALGGLDSDSAVSETSPLSKALRDAAAKISVETMKRSGKLGPRTNAK